MSSDPHVDSRHQANRRLMFRFQFPAAEQVSPRPQRPFPRPFPWPNPHRIERSWGA
ncbi:hypothetical protein M5D96_012372 [Drosophila gunungcola]|uniref:Uncharacterized protein n=1 Tax=Drosophila gunungcola TaxID=103775 RepID=A0A9P9YDC7_9MUSC|nr:hypothetical protein M5D96_012372 [Drosophila gunungcola]